MSQIFVNQKYHETNGNWTNNVHVKEGESVDEALQKAMHQFHAFMSTYAYGESPNGKQIDYVSCSVEDLSGLLIKQEVDDRMVPTPPNAE